MGFRIGRKFGNYYVSSGKSGVRVSTKIGGYTISHFNPSRKTSKTKKTEKIDDFDYSIASEEENDATTRTLWWNFALTLVFLLTVWISGKILIPIGVLLLVQAIGAYKIWKNVDTDIKWLYWFFPIVSLFVTPIAWVYWIAVFVIVLFL